ncbi:MAG: phosphonoacetaldehyde reductase [Chitinophagaceae bacterium]|nr:phosphonoacetaldehyde reductase [Chitinophagaceae bacterium]
MSAAQRLIQGENSINQLPAAIKNRYPSVFLITGKHFQLADHPGLFKGLSITHYVRSGAIVEEEEVERAFNEFSNNTSQAIVAIGGGSVIDLAKGIVYRCIQLGLAVPYFIAIPTTAGSGSEATHFAVVYRDKKKYSLVHESLLPQLVVLDPVLTYSVSPYQTAVSGMDAFSQAIESFWNVNATDESKRFATGCIEWWEESFLKTVGQPSPGTRRKMLMASNLAGRAINITRTTGPHALSYYLTTNHDIPHGQAVALFLPAFFLYNAPQEELCSLLKVRNESGAREMIRQIMEQAGLATSFSGLNLDKENVLDKLLDEVNQERFANNPAPFDREKLKQLIREYL